VVTYKPLHSSARADFPHPALASGNDAEAAHGIQVRDVADASREESSFALNTRPARTPVNPSTIASREASHDSGSQGRSPFNV
jgi:hypothetical protein